MNKVIEISLIENREKKKKVEDNTQTLEDYKTKIINDLEDMITLKFFDNSNNPEIRNSDKFIDIRNSFVIFYNTYIEINKWLIGKNSESKIVKEILDNLIENVVERFEKTNKDKKVIESLKEVELIGNLIKKHSEDVISVSMIDD
jgi:hypothetical protein